MKPPYRYCVITLLAGTGACSTYSTESTVLSAPANICEEPRPQVCTMEYRPVCASLSDGSMKTYASGCSACGDTQVQSWVENECPG